MIKSNFGGRRLDFASYDHTQNREHFFVKMFCEWCALYFTRNPA